MSEQQHDEDDGCKMTNASEDFKDILTRRISFST